LLDVKILQGGRRTGTPTGNENGPRLYEWVQKEGGPLDDMIKETGTVLTRRTQGQKGLVSSQTDSGVR